MTSQCPHFHVLPSTLSPPTVARGRDPLARASESLLAPSSPHCPTFNTPKLLHSPEVQNLQGGEAREAASQRLGTVVADPDVSAGPQDSSQTIGRPLSLGPRVLVIPQTTPSTATPVFPTQDWNTLVLRTVRNSRACNKTNI